jgi:uncharacterized damage-inducible protein DinB
MLAMLRDLIRHKAFANTKLLIAIRRHQAAAQDDELRSLLHHVLVANRFWLALSLELPFDPEKETPVPESLEAIAALYRTTHSLELNWICRAQQADLARSLETPFLPGRRFSVAQALMQVCLHSQGHRAQCGSRLRLLGGTPPSTDFILWLKDRPPAAC